MSSTLGPLAIHQILAFTEEDYRRRKPKLKKAARVPQVGLMARHVSPKWGHIYELYFSGKDPPPLDYLRSPELLLKFKDVLDRRDMQVVFGHEKPIVLDEDVPQRFVSQIVQAFLGLREEPSSLDITVNIPYVKTWRQTHEAGSTSVQSKWPAALTKQNCRPVIFDLLAMASRTQQLTLQPRAPLAAHLAQA